MFPGDKHGVMNMYTLNLNPNDPEGKGSNVSHSIDTVAGLNDDLFSMSAYYDELNCDIELKHKGFSGITGTHPNTGAKIRIPVRYHYGKRAWLVDYVVCRNPAIAQRVGTALEAALEQQEETAAWYAAPPLAQRNWAMHCGINGLFGYSQDSEEDDEQHTQVGEEEQ